MRSNVFRGDPTYRPLVMLADDDVAALDIFTASLKSHPVRTITANSAREAARLAYEHKLDLMVLDLRLGDSNGLDVVERIAVSGACVPFILISGFLTVKDCLMASRLGADEVLEKPIDSERLVAAVLKSVRRRTESVSARFGPPGESYLWDDESATSNLERWISYILRSISCPGDFRTMREWARFLGVSATSLSECCRLLNVPPHSARDFARMLRASVKAQSSDCPIEFLLNVADSRTLATLLRQSGILRIGGHVGAAEFIDHQQFIPHDHRALAVLRKHVSSRHWVALEDQED